MAEDNRLAGSPILVEDLGPIRRSERAHACASVVEGCEAEIQVARFSASGDDRVRATGAPLITLPYRFTSAKDDGQVGVADRISGVSRRPRLHRGRSTFVITRFDLAARQVLLRLVGAEGNMTLRQRTACRSRIHNAR